MFLEPENLSFEESKNNKKSLMMIVIILCQSGSVETLFKIILLNNFGHLNQNKVI